MKRMRTGTLAWISILAFAPALFGGAERSYVSGNFTMTLDGADAGFLKSIDGGAIAAEVIDEPSGSNLITRKHIGPPRYEDFVAQVGVAGSRELQDWIAQSWSKPGSGRAAASSPSTATWRRGRSGSSRTPS